MMSAVYFGKIKEERLLTWSENKDPFDILVENNEIEGISGWDFLGKTGTFHSKVQVDWGSFAYKCTKSELMNVANALLSKSPWLEQQRKKAMQKINELDDSSLYGVVFVELY